ncbi:uncharacterized protein LOC135502803 [Lineus longissimus]|uniref:uncharacterized protein LOC135502803 n=1 Tax=Lineus longissimus TaxID=88925 RepID=UPI00315C60A8
MDIGLTVHGDALGGVLSASGSRGDEVNGTRLIANQVVAELKPALSQMISESLDKMLEEKLKPVIWESVAEAVDRKCDKLLAAIRVGKYENDKLEQYTRNESIRVFHLQETEGEKEEDLRKKIVEIGQAMDVLVVESDISVTHRLGKKGRNPRPVICKFVRRSVKQAFMFNKKNLKAKENYKNVFIVEDLTPLRTSLMRFVKEKKLAKHVYSMDGKIVCIREETKNGQKVESKVFI